MARVWGVHMPIGIGSEAMDKGQVSIGWSAMGDIRQLPDDRQTIKAKMAAVWPEQKAQSIAISAGVILRFLHEIQADDYVVYPSKHDRMINIGRFTGELVYEQGLEDETDSYPNSRRVQWLGHFPRDNFSQSALNEIGSFLTLFLIQKHDAEFLAKVNPAAMAKTQDENEAAPDDDIVSGSVARQAEITAEDFTIRRIHTGLTGHEFEHFFGHLLECMGYTVRVTQKSADGGIDVIAHNDKLGFEPPIIKVQCKRTTNQINETQVRELLGTLVEGEYGLFVTLGAFAPKVRQSERNLPKLRLIDGEQLFDLIAKHYADLSPRYRTLIPLRQIYVPDIAD